MKKLIIVCAILMVASMVPMAAAITVDGHKGPVEWNEDWAYGQTQGTGYDEVGPFGDRLVIRQGGFTYPTTDWYDIDPQDDSGPTFSDTMATSGIVPSGYDIMSLSARYDPGTDTLYGMCEVYGMPGDLDGNNDIATDELSHGDGLGDAGPAGSGVGPYETWELKASQNGDDIWIVCSNNDWVVFDGIPLPYDQVDVKFASTGVNPCYEIAISDLSTYFDVSFGANPIMVEAKGGGNRDVPGEDTATAFLYLPDPAIDIEKHTNGVDADHPRGPYLNLADTVTWEYIVTNTGDVTLNNIVVIDDEIGAITLPKTTLVPGESMTATATGTVTDYGQYENEAEVTGEYSVITVSDMDPSHYYCSPPTEVPALTPAGLLSLIGLLGIIGIVAVKRRD